MRYIILLLLLSVAASIPQNGFFSNIRNSFFGRPQTPRRPPQIFPQQPPQNFPPSQQNNFPPPGAQRQPRPQPPQGRPVQERPVQQTNVPQVQVQGLRNNPPQQPLNNQNQIQPAQSTPSFTPGLISKSLESCPGASANHEWEGNRYILTWVVDGNKCSSFTADEAEAYCNSQGGRAVSLDTTSKAVHFHNVAAIHAMRGFWTGGRIDHGAGVVTWKSGNREGYVRGQRFWSPTGGIKPEPEPQPDNKDGNEICIAVLNNYYADGIKWHDLACHQRKPTICELPELIR